MSQSANEHLSAHDPILERLKELENRVSFLEEETGLAVAKRYRPLVEEDSEMSGEEILSGSLLESRFGDFGLAWLGNLVMLFGIIFLAQYLQNIGYKYFSSALGYIAVIGIFGLAYYFRGTLSNLTSVFRLTGYILLYFITLRLHFFTKDPILAGPYFCLALLVMVSFIQGYIAFREKSQRMAVLAIVMTLVTAVVSNSTHFMLSLVTAIAIASVFFMVRFGWWRVLIFAVIMVYLANLIWLTGNPFMNHSFQVIKSHEFGIILPKIQTTC
ncbi:MAG: DUF2339 domain-containing protein [Bacteroidales bacterium]|nr:DUF2339 domain-containing protein [Bacteroidales bacterium]